MNGKLLGVFPAASAPLVDPRRPRSDFGLFGPDSISWRIWGYPTALIGFQRAIVVETFDPDLTAAIDATNKYRSDVHGRMDGTGEYFITVAYADAQSAIEASEAIMAVHARQTGIDPLRGTRFNANRPSSQLWIHITGWQSVLIAYERYGPGPLTKDEDRRFWAEAAVAAELQTCDPADVPRSREEVRGYYAAMRPHLRASDASRAAAHHLLRPSGTAGPVVWPISRLLARATIATIPAWMREEGGFDQPRAVDATARIAARAAMRAFAPVPMRLAALELFMPSVRPILEQVLRGGPPREARTVTVADARARYGRRGARPLTPA